VSSDGFGAHHVHPQRGGRFGGLDVEVETNLEVIGHEANRCDDDIAYSLGVELPEVIDDVGLEPRCPGRSAAALIDESPVVLVSKPVDYQPAGLG
jgi:hypothetical protein